MESLGIPVGNLTCLHRARLGGERTLHRVYQVAQLRAVECELGFCYSPALWAVADALQTVADAPGFTAAFPLARTPTEQDFAIAWDLGLPKSMVLFLCEAQPTHMDYYCCERQGDQLVVVFADHAVVEVWSDFGAFLAWLQQQCGGDRA